MDISHYIACYNEEKYIIKTLEKLIVSAKLEKINNEIIVIDDASTDNSYNCIVNFIKKKKIKNIVLIKRNRNLGISENYKYALKISKGCYFRMICGDDVELKKTHIKIFKKLHLYDIINPIYITVYNKSFFRKIISKLFTIFVNLFSGNNVGYYNGSVAIKKNLIKNSYLNKGFGFQSYLISKILKKNGGGGAGEINNNELKYIEIKTEALHREKRNNVILKNILYCLKTLTLIFINRLKN